MELTVVVKFNDLPSLRSQNRHTNIFKLVLGCVYSRFLSCILELSSALKNQGQNELCQIKEDISLNFSDQNSHSKDYKQIPL